MGLLSDFIYTEAALEKLELDNSTMDIFGLCPRKFLYRKVLKLVPARNAPQLSFGTAFHAGLDSYYNGDNSVKVLEEFAKGALKADLDFPKTRAEAIERGFKGEHSIEFGFDLMVKYMEAYPLDKEPFKLMKDAEGKSMTEKGFALHLSNGVLVGKMDAILEGGDLMEHKTASQYLKTPFLMAFTVNNQISLYMAALRDLLGYRPKRCRVNCIMVKDYKKNNGEKDTKLFARALITKTNDQLDQTLRQFEFRINQIKNFLRIGFDAFYQNAPNACKAFWTQCPYFELCLAQEESQVEILMQSDQYKFEDWHPFDLEGADIALNIEARPV